jgi:hypothetical protein
LRKIIVQNSKASLILNVEKVNIFSPETGDKAGYLLSPFSFDIEFIGGHSYCNTGKEGNKGHKDGNGRSKSVLCADYMIVNVKNPRQSSKIPKSEDSTLC